MEHNLLALTTHIVLKVMVSNVFKVRINCRIEATKTVEEIIMSYCLLNKKKSKKFLLSPGLMA